MYQAVIAIRTTTKKSQCHTAINIFSRSQNGRSSVVQQIWAQLGRWFQSAGLFHIPHSGKLTHAFLRGNQKWKLDVSEHIHIGSDVAQCHFHSHSIG